MLNKVMIIGRLGRDPEVRYTQSGAPVTTLNIATDESYTSGTVIGRSVRSGIVWWFSSVPPKHAPSIFPREVWCMWRENFRPANGGSERTGSLLDGNQGRSRSVPGSQGGSRRYGGRRDGRTRAAPCRAVRRQPWGGRTAAPRSCAPAAPIWMKTLARPSLPRPAIWTIFRSEGGVCGMRGESPLLSAMCVSAKGEIRKADGGRIPSARLW